MLKGLKVFKVLILVIFLFLPNYVSAEEEDVNIEAIADQIQVITNDIKTLEKAVYQKSDVVNLKPSSSVSSDGLNEDIMTKHLLKLNEIEDQFRELTNRFEEVNFKLDKHSTRVTKIQSDTQLRFLFFLKYVACFRKVSLAAVVREDLFVAKNTLSGTPEAKYSTVSFPV